MKKELGKILVPLMKEFVNKESDDDTDEWYISSKGVAEVVMSLFSQFLKDKGIDIEVLDF